MMIANVYDEAARREAIMVIKFNFIPTILMLHCTSNGFLNGSFEVDFACKDSRQGFELISSHWLLSQVDVVVGGFFLK